MSAGVKQNDLQPTWEQRASKCHAKVVEVLTDHPDWSYAQAWKFAAEQNPELFNGKDSPRKSGRIGSSITSASPGDRPNGQGNSSRHRAFVR